MPDESALDDAYAELGVASTASELEITRAYLQLRRFAGDPAADPGAAAIERAYAIVRAARGIPDPRENLTEQISVFADAPRSRRGDTDRDEAGRASDDDRRADDDRADGPTTRAYGDELAFLRGETASVSAEARGEADTVEIDEDARDTAPIPASPDRSPAVGPVDDAAGPATGPRDAETAAWTVPLASADAPASTAPPAAASAAAAPSMAERTRGLASRAADGAAARGRSLAAAALSALDARRRARRGPWTLGLATGPLRSSWTEADDLAADRRRLIWAAALALAMIAAWLPIGLTALQTVVDYVQARSFELWTATTGIAAGEALFALFLALAARSVAAARGRVRGGAVLMMLVSVGLVALAVWQSTLVARSLAPVALFALAFVARARRRAWLAYEEERRGAELWERLVDGAAGGGRRLHWVIQAIPRYAGRQSEVLIETQGTAARETILLWGAHAPGRWIDIDRSSGSVVAWATDACRTSWDALESRARRARERAERG